MRQGHIFGLLDLSNHFVHDFRSSPLDFPPDLICDLPLNLPSDLLHSPFEVELCIAVVEGRGGDNCCEDEVFHGSGFH